MLQDVERMSVSLDELEAAEVRRLAAEDRRSVGSMVRRLVAESLDRRAAGGDGGWSAAARRAPAMRDDAVADARRAAAEGEPSVTQARLLGSPAVRGAAAGLPVEAAAAADRALRAASTPGGHDFAPQSGNVLRCASCGGKKGDHRG
jgi:hypothetical protein